MSKKIYWTAMLFVLVLAAYFTITSYNAAIASKQQDTLDKLQGIAATLSIDFSGDQLEALLKEYQTLDAISSTTADSTYLALHNRLKAGYQINKLNSDIYTLTYDSVANHFYFGVTSGENPYFRHIYDSHPQDYIKNYLTGGKIDRFEDENGVWLSAIAPVKNSQGNVVAVIAVDQHFDDFTAEARNLLLKDTLISLLVIAILSISLSRILKQILEAEERSTRMIEESSRLLEEKNKKITDSIQYAKRIQEALMKDNQLSIACTADYFQIYLPRDIVSGDFLWYHKNNSCDKLFIANVDCTGHGVPGALISIIGISALQEIVVDKGLQKPDEILQLLDHKTQKLLSQRGRKDAIRDGMDVGLCVIDYEKMQLEFAGAHRPLVYVSNGELEVIKGNRFSVGGGYRKGNQELNNFDCKQVKIKPKDRIYLYSDGIIDQFGGSKARAEKFKTRRLLAKIADIQKEPMCEQGNVLLETFEDWKGEQRQIDDVSMVGIEI